ncbi:MAG: ABC transporter permease, partial [Lachnospiraceae bacterium]|nr:ABC transporter permease [Lachnospiraceae bacterium]
MNKNSKASLFLGLPYYLWAAFFIVIPLFMVVWYGLTDKTGAFTLANVLSIMRPAHMKALILSIVLSLGATAVCLLLAYPLCMFLVESQKEADSFLVMLL